MSNSKMKLMAIFLVVLVALALSVSITGCKKSGTETTANDVQQFDQEISGFDDASTAVSDLGSEFNDSELEDIEGMF